MTREEKADKLLVELNAANQGMFSDPRSTEKRDIILAFADEIRREEWTLCDCDKPDTLPPFETVVEFAVMNNGQMARAYGGRSGYDDGWAWFQAEHCLLYGGLPVGFDDAMEWDDEKIIWWKPLFPLPATVMSTKGADE